MKTKFCLLIPIAILLYCCQQKDWAGSDENDIEIDSAEMSGINDNLLRKWFSLNRESDSIIKSSQLIIDKQREEVDAVPGVSVAKKRVGIEVVANSLKL